MLIKHHSCCQCRGGQLSSLFSSFRLCTGFALETRDCPRANGTRGEGLLSASNVQLSTQGAQGGLDFVPRSTVLVRPLPH